MSKIDFTTYQSAFSWRYGSEEMRRIFSEVNKRKTWRKVWVALAKAQKKAGLLTDDEFKSIEKNAANIDIERAHEIEKEIYHDLMAEIRTFAEQSGKSGGKIHLGSTSTDIEDNAQIINIHEALNIIEKELIELLKSFAVSIQKYQNLVCMGYTHLQPAEPTTLGYRFAAYTQDLLNDLKLLRFYRQNLRAKGMKGAVGTSASYVKLLDGKSVDAFKMSNQVMAEFGLTETTVNFQTYPRKTDLHLTFVLSGIAQSLHKFAFDLRIMQSPNFGEWSEPRGEKRVGSSAMPFKRNPDKAEKICSLARYISSLTDVAWNNAANTLLERTLDDSASRRIFIPELFLATDEILKVATELIDGLVIFEKSINRNLEKFGPFAATETLMMEAAKNGADRQKIHEVIREIAMESWNAMNDGKSNPLVEMLKKDKIITKFVKPDKISLLLDPATHTGLASKRCLMFLKELQMELKND